MAKTQGTLGNLAYTAKGHPMTAHYVNATHTPGPWISEEEAGEWFISAMHGQTKLCHATVYSKADASLIAAAPDLLVALSIAEESLMMATHGDEYCEFDEQLKTIRAALAKATP